jgi:hypothetical protein
MTLGKLLFVPILAVIASLTGCATPTTMAYSDPAKPVPVRETVYLMSLTIKNSYHPSFQPHAFVVYVERPDAKEKSDRFNFLVDKKARLAELDSVDEGNSYLLRLHLPPGTYVVRGVESRSFKVLINSMFFTPIHEPLSVTEPGVCYLGHIEAVVRERQGDEFRAGPVIPLVDQSAAGASGGTFDVVVSDAWEQDEGKFRSHFPELSTASIQKSVLPPFDRGTAQQWWEKH